MFAQIQARHPERHREIGEDVLEFVADEELAVLVDKILPKLDLDAAPGPTEFWNGYLRLWTGVFAPTSAEEATDHRESLISDMANDKALGWFMQAMQAADLIAIVKNKTTTRALADHRPVGIPNTLSKIADRAMLQLFQAE